MDISKFLKLGASTPILLIDLNRIVTQYVGLRQAFGPAVEIFFSVKANNHPQVIRTITDFGGGLDVASWPEVELAFALGVPPRLIAFSNPVKIPDDVTRAFAAGIRLFALDSSAEITKLARLAPGSDCYLRLRVDNRGSGWPLEGKFGAEEREALSLLIEAQRAGLNVVGLTFHVGSQCGNLRNWRNALAKCRRVWNQARAAGLQLRLLNLGGGLPARYSQSVPTAEAIGNLVRERLAGFNGLERCLIEPGRYLVAEAGTLVASVIGRAVRDGETLVYLDVGLFNGLMEAYECFWYPVETPDAVGRPLETVTLVGPTCDSVDVIVRRIRLPQLAIGDRVVFRSAGAYTNSNERYNGFSFPPVVLCGSGK